MSWRDWFQQEWKEAGCTGAILFVTVIVVIFGGLILAATLTAK